jgi:hypothetical protein
MTRIILRKHTNTTTNKNKKNTVPLSVKGKAIPLQAWTGLEGYRRLTIPDFKTFGT